VLTPASIQPRRAFPGNNARDLSPFPEVQPSPPTKVKVKSRLLFGTPV